MHYDGTLQLVSSACHNGLLLVNLWNDALSRLISCPSESTESLAKDWVAEVVAGVHPVSIHGAQVLDLQLDQAASQFVREAKVLSKGIGLELVATGEDVHQQLDDGVCWSEDIGEQDEANNDWADAVEAEGLIERGIVDEDGEQAEDVEEVGLDHGQ